MTTTFITKNEQETKQLACDLVQSLVPGDVLALEGELGAGKTTFAQGLAKGMKIESVIDSPTFTIVKEYYPIGSPPLYHMDVYRIDPDSEEAMELEEYFYGEGICLVEWASRIVDWLPENTIYVDLSVSPDQSRNIQLTTHLSRVIQWCEEVKKK